MKKFNTFNGVFIPSYEAILGAVLFLLLPGLTAGVGMVGMVVIIILANTATTATTFSISDCATNLSDVGSGGMYAVSKRSLGKAFGGSIGIQLYLAQAASIGFYAIAFAVPLQSLMSGIPEIHGFALKMGLSTPLLQKQAIAYVIAFIAFISGIIGADFVVKIQALIFVILTVSVLSIFVSPLFKPNIMGTNIFMDSPNMFGSIKELGFWAAFATFFPAVTGIDAGVGMSGNLKEPRRSLGKGTFLAIGITTVIYVSLAVLFSFIEPRFLADIGTTQTGGTKIIYKSLIKILRNLPLIPVILTSGVLFATGSSALSYFMTAPRTAQALVKDKLLPRFLNFLGDDFSRKGNEPRWATVLTFAIAVFIISLGDVDVATLVVGICFLVVYGWVNVAAFFERISGNPSFRPTSKGHWSISLFGFLICMLAIMLFNPIAGIIIFSLQLIIFILLLFYKTNNQLEGVWWGLLFSYINWGLRRIRHIMQDTKNWRPIVGVFCFHDKGPESLQVLEMGARISKFKGLTMVNVLQPHGEGKVDFTVPKDASIIKCRKRDYQDVVLSVMQSNMPGGLMINTALFPLEERLAIMDVVSLSVEYKKNVLLYKHGQIAENAKNRIDIWWKGQKNGNLMALLAYIIKESDIQQGVKQQKIRILRKLFEGQDHDTAYEEMNQLLTGARLLGEIEIVPSDKSEFMETLKEYSSDSSLILMGMPGKPAKGLSKLFDLDEKALKKELGKYKDLPPLLFVKAQDVVNLFE